MNHVSLKSISERSLLFLSGKGGVGKTLLSESLALAISNKQRKTLWVTFEDPSFRPGETIQRNNHLWHLNCDGHRSFEEYIELKIKVPTLARMFLRNKAVEFLSKTAPGVHELVLLGKVWSLRNQYDQIICDMPSTGYGLAMFQSVQNFSKLFHSGAVRKDSDAMYETLADPKTTGNIIIGLPEEMPLQEGLELEEFYSSLFPKNPSAFLVNRCYPSVESNKIDPNPDQWNSPLAETQKEYLVKRSIREKQNLKLWSDKNIDFSLIHEVPNTTHLNLHENLSEQFKEILA